MTKSKKTDLKKLVKKAEIEDPKNSGSSIEIHTVEPVIKTKIKSKKSEEKINHDEKKTGDKKGKKTGNKTEIKAGGNAGRKTGGKGSKKRSRSERRIAGSPRAGGEKERIKGTVWPWNF